MADKKRKAEKTFENNSMLGKINKRRKKRQQMLDQIMNPNNRKYGM